MNAFIVWTPLHVINIINAAINLFPGEENDVYLYDEFSGAEEIYRLLEKEQIFHRVTLISHHEIGSTARKIISLVLNKQHFIQLDQPYERIFIQGENYFAKLLYGEMKKRNPELELHYIEDGLGAYVGSPVIRIDNKGNQLIRRLNRHSIFHASISSYSIYEPKLVLDKKEVPYYKLPKLNEKNKAWKVIQRLFPSGDTNPAAIQGKTLFFDQPFQSDGFAIDENYVLKRIEKTLPPNQLIIKFHPRSDSNKYGEFQRLDTDLPWELYCLKYPIKNTLLISIATTAAFTPYLMFGMKPPVVLLASCCLEELEKSGDKERTKTMLKSVIQFAERFQEKTGMKVSMPESFSELDALFSPIESKTGRMKERRDTIANPQDH